MNKPVSRKSLPLAPEAFDHLMPLHLRLNGLGQITALGPTLARLLPANVLGLSLFDVFDLRRARGPADVAGLMSQAGERLHLTFRPEFRSPGARPIPFRGMAIPLADRSGLVVNLSFGLGVVDAIRHYGLTDSDFAPTDLALEMMYLVEAKTAAMDALRGFAIRLQGDKQMAEAQAMTDTLTGLRNRRALAQALERLSRGTAPFALMHLDLDFFKDVNDTLGHAAGDHVLRRVAELLMQETRAEDTVARVGGDEFVAVFPDLVDPDRLGAIARRIIEVLSRPIAFEDKLCRISASIGITTSLAYEVTDIARMEQDADEALYASKRGGRGRAIFHPGTSHAPNPVIPDRRHP
ncbi:GGDEF domain-containing protein [Rhodobacter sp. KR11]|jgi:diguanylate cyclase (GGDEF)-like protein|uniref:GGDEF domain-containing protein n=1 Tax=Rhodobacter sp. KR11 TaxID=2974588 RepID=UPI002221BFE0|nr:GGDEF domain-containing protein [Rhodobacter sp. KR11]MCW1919731.1 GGDEF domain-containing protein [Rhodobacter sp. KR11]